MCFLESEIDLLKCKYVSILRSSEYTDEQLSNFLDYVIPSLALHNANMSLNEHWPRLASLNANYDKFFCAFESCGDMFSSKKRYVQHLNAEHRTQLPDGCRFLAINDEQQEQLEVENASDVQWVESGPHEIIKRFYTFHEIPKDASYELWKSEKIEYIYDEYLVTKLDEVLAENKEQAERRQHEMIRRYYGLHVIFKDSLFDLLGECKHTKFIYDKYLVKRLDEVRFSSC
jgi:hypothetical protein